MIFFSQISSEDYLPQLSLMPFLDILFCAIGIFIILFSIQDIISKKKDVSLQADVLIICLNKNKLIWVGHDNESKYEIDADQMIEKLKHLIKTTKTAPHLLIALKPDSFKTWAQLLKQLDSYSQYDEKDNSINFNPIKTLWPLPDNNNSEYELIQQWRSNNKEN